MASTQKEYLTEIADAIREKEQTEAPIQASEFAARIKALKIGGGTTNDGKLTAENTTGWETTDIADGDECSVTFTWASENEGEGAVTVSVGGTLKEVRKVAQGSVTVDLQSCLATGANTVTITILDAKNNIFTLTYTVTSHANVSLKYYSADGAQLLHTESVKWGGNGTYATAPTKEQTAQYTFTFAGWNSQKNAETAEEGVRDGLKADKSVYAAFSKTVRKYTVKWNGDGDVTLETDTEVPYGTVPTYDGETPTKEGYEFTGWKPEVAAITGDTTYTAQFVENQGFTVYFYNGDTLLQTVENVKKGGTANFTGDTPKKTGVDKPDDWTFTGWLPSNTNIQGDTSCYAQYKYALVEENIEDDWDAILAACADGSYKTKYHVGDTKQIDLGSEGVVAMQIVAMDADELPDGGKAPLSWVSRELLKTSHKMNPYRVTRYAKKSYTGTNKWTEVSTHKYQSANSGKDSSESQGYWVVTPSESGSININWTCDSEYADCFSLYIDKKPVVGSNTTGQSGTVTIECTAQTPIDVFALYTKDSSSKSGTDKATIEITSDISFEMAEGETSTVVTDGTSGYIDATGSIGGWGKSEMRKYLQDTIKPLIPVNVRGGIKKVVKYAGSYDTAGKTVKDERTEDEVWIPSADEVDYAYSTSFETNKLSYMPIKTGTDGAKKHKTGSTSAVGWWLRSAHSCNSDRFCYVASDGIGYYNYAHYVYGVALGFCT